MGYRLTRISTRTGDDGTTGLGDGRRVPKDDPRIEVLGDLDELNCILGVVRSFRTALELPELELIQQTLFELGAEIAVPGASRIQATHITTLDETLERHNASLPPLKEFLLPGGTSASAHCHLARAVCRRLERELVRLSRQSTVRGECLAYINRLSDVLFVLARVLARQEGTTEPLWQPGASQ